MKDRRIGKFLIDLHVFDERPRDVRAVMDACVVIRAEALLGLGAIEYVAVSPHFAPVKRGEVIPSYQWRLRLDHTLDTIRVEGV